ncbi:putative cell wall-associated protein [Microscilla marina ATCC 23134]|uniref:Putative cell wall-associated protein n=1 Tax=Microscilla marina ATCC 23134 TaxID=313606 RepID=A1ZXI9_MICM2|nr:putative cell wall-associated protein [Microscilla marina ATCC 23134]
MFLGTLTKPSQPSGETTHAENLRTLQVGLSFTPPNPSSQSSGLPNAYLRYVLYDETGTKALQSGRVFVTTAAKTHWERLHFDYEVPANGVLQIYIANETEDEPVYFDDMVVEHTPQLIVQENHYYPFGLELEGLSKHGKPEHRWKFTSVELVSDFDLQWYDYKYRKNYNSQVARFFSVDPIAEEYIYLTPYQHASNNPASNIEIEGLEGQPVAGNEKAGNKAKHIPVVAGMSKAAGETAKATVTQSGAGRALSILGVAAGTGVLVATPHKVGVGSSLTDDPRHAHKFRSGGEGRGGVVGEMLFNITKAKVENALNTDEQRYLKELRERPAGSLSGQEKNDLQWLEGKESQSRGSSTKGVEITFKTKEVPAIAKLAEQTFVGNEALRNEANGLLEQVKKGNDNPGIGTKSIGDGIHELRGRKGVRIYFKNTDNGIEILGYSDKKNQQKVIKKLKEVYGKK